MSEQRRPIDSVDTFSSMRPGENDKPRSQDGFAQEISFPATGVRSIDPHERLEWKEFLGLLAEMPERAIESIGRGMAIAMAADSIVFMTFLPQVVTARH